MIIALILKDFVPKIRSRAITWWFLVYFATVYTVLNYTLKWPDSYLTVMFLLNEILSFAAAVNLSACRYRICFTISYHSKTNSHLTIRVASSNLYRK